MSDNLFKMNAFQPNMETIMRSSTKELENVLGDPGKLKKVINEIKTQDVWVELIDELVATRIKEDLDLFLDQKEELEAKEEALTAADKGDLEQAREIIPILSNAYAYFKQVPEPQERYHEYISRMFKETR